jgi:D-glycero-alpha-D-manno-heptose-7-phosphate kinase
VSVRLEVQPRRAGHPPAVIEAINFDESYAFVPGTRPWGRHPLLEAAIESVGVPEELSVRVRVWSDVPPGASTGTSAAVTVALVAAMRRGIGLPVDRRDVAARAHRVETDLLGRQSGVQDQVAAAVGGVNFLAVPEFPRVEITPLPVSESLRTRLNASLMLVYLGRSHDSSQVHRAVIGDIDAMGPQHPALAALRDAALQARDAILAEDLGALARAMLANTEGQRRLHPMLVGPDAAAVIDAAMRHDVPGWKVNGAGGGGGSVTLLLPPSDVEYRQMMEAALKAAAPACQVLPISLSPDGLRVEAMTE